MGKGVSLGVHSLLGHQHCYFVLLLLPFFAFSPSRGCSGVQAGRQASGLNLASVIHVLLTTTTTKEAALLVFVPLPFLFLHDGRVC